MLSTHMIRFLPPLHPTAAAGAPPNCVPSPFPAWTSMNTSTATAGAAAVRCLQVFHLHSNNRTSRRSHVGL